MESKMSRGAALGLSKRRLAYWLNGLGFKIIKIGDRGKHWVLDRDGESFYIEVKAHVDGSQADYRICTSAWNHIQ